MITSHPKCYTRGTSEGTTVPVIFFIMVQTQHCYGLISQTEVLLTVGYFQALQLVGHIF